MTTTEPRTPVMMKCGHAANGYHVVDGERFPACVICAPSPEGTTVDENPPSLEGRTAECSMCHRQVPSKIGLPFFERGGILKSSPHINEWHEAGKIIDRARIKHGFRPGPWQVSSRGRSIREVNAEPEVIAAIAESQRLLRLVKQTATLDGYYCGCRGWD